MISPSRGLLLLVARLYPRAWRARYGEEFAALIEDLPEGRARWATVGDTLRGALWMRVRTGVTGLALFGGLAGLAVGAAVALAMPDRYITGAVVRVEQGVPEARLTAVVARSLDREQLARLIAKYGLYSGRADALERMERDIYVSVMYPRADGSRAMRISFAHAVPETARTVATALTAMSLEGQAGLQLLDEPALPQSPVSPNRFTISVFGMQLGLAAGLVAGVLRSAAARLRSRA